MIDKTTKSIGNKIESDWMKEIEEEDLIKNLKRVLDRDSTIDMDAVDFVLLKLNEIRYEVSLKLKDREKKVKYKNVS